MKKIMSLFLLLVIVICSVVFTVSAAVSITLSNPTVKLYVGQSKTVTATTSPKNKTVKWSSSDKSIATVSSSGKITGVKAGTAKIMASFNYNGESYGRACTVNVSKPSVSLNSTTLSVNLGSSKTLKATTAPSGQTVKWKTSDKTVATVSSSGKVTAVKSGTAKITAYFTYGGKTYSKVCTVTISKPSIKLNVASTTIYVGGSKTIKVTAVPATQKVTWKSSDKSVATVSSTGKVSAIDTGTSTITAYFTRDGKTYSAKCVVTVKTPSIKLNKTSASINVGTKITLKATTAPSDQTVKWKTSNSNIATVSSKGVVTGVRKGKVTITAYFTYNETTYKRTCTVTVNNDAFGTLYEAVIRYGDFDGDDYTIMVVANGPSGERYPVSVSYNVYDEALYFYTQITGSGNKSDCILAFNYVPYERHPVSADIYTRILWSDGTEVSGTAYDVIVSDYNPEAMNLKFNGIPKGYYTQTANALATYGVYVFDDFLNNVFDMSLSDLGFTYI